MPKFAYIARDSKGSKVTGFEEAASQDDLISRLQIRNLTVVNVSSELKEERQAAKAKTEVEELKYSHYGISGDDLVIFSRQLATLIDAGVTILRSLETISKQVTSRKFYNVLQELIKNMEAGLSLHEAMSKYPKVFSELWVNLVESGEASGNLALILSRLAGYLERNASFKRKIISSLIYPAILMLAGIGALLFLTMKIIPTFAELFKGFNASLPFLTRVLILVSLFIRKSIFIFIGLILALFFMLKKYFKTGAGRRRYETFMANLPIFGKFSRALVVERFSAEMSTLIESGVPLLYSLEITEHSVDNLIMADILRKIKEDVREGKPLSNSLDKSGFFEPMVIQMVTIGEDTGELPQMLKRINAFYQEYTETFLSRFTTLFEPFMLIFMGLVIGIMVVGMFLPIFQIATMGLK